MSDGAGLFLQVEPNGSKLWRLAYRFDGKQKLLALGRFPETSLAAAREKRDIARKQLAAGIDPSSQRRIERLAAKHARGNSFRILADEYLAKLKREGRNERTLSKNAWLLNFASSMIGPRPVSEISAPELLSVLQAMERRGKYESASRLRGTCGAVFRYAIATGRAERDPSQDLRGALTAPVVKHRSTIVRPTEIGALLRAIEKFEGDETVKAALKLTPLLFVRPAELRKAEWNEFDLDRAEWRIPAKRMKMRREHRVPLASQAVTILGALKTQTQHSTFVFPSSRSWLRPMSANAVNNALQRIGYSSEDITAHGFRAMASTILNESGLWNRDAIERQLAHEEENKVRAAYTHAAEYLQERVRMMTWWADELERMKELPQTSD